MHRSRDGRTAGSTNDLTLRAVGPPGTVVTDKEHRVRRSSNPNLALYLHNNHEVGFSSLYGATSSRTATGGHAVCVSVMCEASREEQVTDHVENQQEDGCDEIGQLTARRLHFDLAMLSRALAC